LGKGALIMQDDYLEKGEEESHCNDLSGYPDKIMPDEEALAAFDVVVHQNAAYCHHQHSGQDDTAGIEQQGGLRNFKPGAYTKGGVQVEKEQCKAGCEEYRGNNIPLFRKVHGQLFAQVNIHGISCNCKSNTFADLPFPA